MGNAVPLMCSLTGSFSALDTNERCTLLILSSILNSGRKLSTCSGAPLPMSVWMLALRVPTNIMFFDVKVSEGSSPCHPPWLTCPQPWLPLALSCPRKSSLCCARRMFWVCTARQQSICAEGGWCAAESTDGQHWRDAAWPWASREQDTLAESHLKIETKEYGQGWVVTMFCSCLCGRSLMFFRFLFCRGKKHYQRGSLPRQFLINDL